MSVAGGFGQQPGEQRVQLSLRRYEPLVAVHECGQLVTVRSDMGGTASVREMNVGFQRRRQPLQGRRRAVSEGPKLVEM